MIMGDWNVDVGEIQQMRFDEEVQGSWMAQGQATVQTGNELDFGLVSTKIRILVSQTVDWHVPFRPHAAVKQILHWRAGQVPVLQVGKPKGDHKTPNRGEVQILMENLTGDPDSERFAC